MFIRKTVTKIKMTNKQYKKMCWLNLIAMQKNKPRQRVIMQLGTLTLPKSKWKNLAVALEGRLADQITLFEDKKHVAEAAEQAMGNYSRQFVSAGLNSVGTGKYVRLSQNW